MGRTRIRQDTQIRKSDVYDDSVAPSLDNYETKPDSVEDDLNSLRSQTHNLLNVQSGKWYDDLVLPLTFENGSKRGVNDLNADLHDLERKRILRRHPVVGAYIGPVDINARHVALGTGELPKNLIAAVGSVTTLGTVVASISGSFNSPSLAEVPGDSGIAPLNIVRVVDAVTGGLAVDSKGNKIYGLLQSEFSVDGTIISDSSPNRLQISFVKHNATHDDLILITAGDMDGKFVEYSPIERYALEDVDEPVWIDDDSGSGITFGQHSILRQLIHFIDDGPAEGFASGSFKETLPAASPFPTSVIWWDSSSKLKKIVERTVTWTGPIPIVDEWKIYGTDGVTVLATVSDVISYSGVFETSRTRTVS